MLLEENIRETLMRVCDQFASAFERYDSISGGEVPPEHLLASYALMSLGDVLTMTSETSSSKLWTWNEDCKARTLGCDRLPAPAQFGQLCGGQRVDLAIFQGNHLAKREMMFLCLVEFKVGWVDDGDLSKLRTLLGFIDTCPYGAICTAVEVPQKNEYLMLRQEKAAAEGRISVRGRIARPLHSRANWQTYAEIMPNPSLVSLA